MKVAVKTLNTLKVIDIKRIWTKGQYIRLFNNIVEILQKYNKDINITIEISNNECIIKKGNYGFILTILGGKDNENKRN